MRILALITARGGSKRVLGKNTRLLGGKPLIEWSINAAKGIAEICDILVSTDDDDIAHISRKAGAMVPWLRPTELATDTASSIDVCLHALNWYEEEFESVDGLLLLQPTSPFRSKTSIINGIDLFKQDNMNTIIGVSPAETHPLFCFKKNGDYIIPFSDDGGLHLRTQDLPPAYEVNGAFYLITPKCLRATRTFFSGNLVPLMFEESDIDIDTEEDWRKAEALLHNKNL